MVVEWLLGLVAGIWDWFGTVFPDWEMPAQLTDPGGVIETIATYADGVGVWIDWTLLAVIAMIPLGVWLIGLAWKGLRTAISHIPFFGGAG